MADPIADKAQGQLLPPHEALIRVLDSLKVKDEHWPVQAAHEYAIAILMGYVRLTEFPKEVLPVIIGRLELLSRDPFLLTTGERVFMTIENLQSRLVVTEEEKIIQKTIQMLDEQ